MGAVPGEDASGLIEYVFFVDHSLGSVKVASALKNAGVRVRVHRDELPQDADDEEWIGLVGDNGWIALSKDKRIKDRPLEQRAIRIAGVRVFTFQSGQVTGDQMAEAFVKALPDIERLLRSHAAPFIAKVYKDGSARMWKEFK